MSGNAMEFIIVVLTGIVIISAVYEFTRYWIKRVEDRREEERIEAWRRRQR